MNKKTKTLILKTISKNNSKYKYNNKNKNYYDLWRLNPNPSQLSLLSARPVILFLIKPTNLSGLTKK
jgi:hypothetical protein